MHYLVTAAGSKYGKRSKVWCKDHCFRDVVAALLEKEKRMFQIGDEDLPEAKELLTGKYMDITENGMRLVDEVGLWHIAKLGQNTI